ncbi:MAG: hypothetical protein VYE22_25930 [Myxococcota bacterium]|nr:hypothetical protein [Myxococcota bacterium]
MRDEKDQTLTEADFERGRAVGRRSALAALGAVGLALVAAPARAQTDSDTGPLADPAGGGRTGATDGDEGAGADRPGHGRNPRRGCTDTDQGRWGDPAGEGSCGCSDADRGRHQDPDGRGRRCR